MCRRVKRVAFILLTGVTLLFLQCLWSYLLHPQIPHLASTGNITWNIDECIKDVVPAHKFPAQNDAIRNLTSTTLADLIGKTNTEQFVTNENHFGRLPSPFQRDLHTSPGAVFLVQVHNRLDNLRALIESLNRVRGIEDALLIFSSDFISNELIALIHSITFARAIQISFPYSIQAFPDMFPGQDPHDCASNMTIQQAKEVHCVNANWSDRFHHFRNPRFTQVKHHWLWKLAFVFERLYAVKHFNGYVILLEDDYYVVEDILHVTKFAENIWKPTEAKGLIAFGSYKSSRLSKDSQVTVEPWVSSRDNMGIGISRAMWERIKPCLNVFCTFDDYNWDWTLHHIGNTCILPRMQAMRFSELTRIHHLGQCNGLHHTSSNCSVRLLAQEITQDLHGPLAASLYPDKLKIAMSRASSIRVRPNGGWADIRDHALCKSIATATWQSEIVQYAPHLTHSMVPL